jgi:tRNA A37 threonylcarbamoyladenosine dehydratase
VRVRDLSRTEHDAMLALIRKKLRAEFNFPRSPQRYFSVPAVYSLENVKYPQADGSVCGVRPQVAGDAALKLDCGAGLGAATHVTGAFAFAMVGKALELLLKPKPKRGSSDDSAAVTSEEAVAASPAG